MKLIVGGTSISMSLALLTLAVWAESLVVAQIPAQSVPARNVCAAPANSIVAENCKQGNPREEWDIYNIGDPQIQGFATEISTNLGDTVQFKVKTHSPRYRIDIYRMGWYGGSGARLFRPSDRRYLCRRRSPSVLFTIQALPRRA